MLFFEYIKVQFEEFKIWDISLKQNKYIRACPCETKQTQVTNMLPPPINSLFTILQIIPFYFEKIT